MSFVKEFDPKNEKHVGWLQEIDQVMLHVTDQTQASKDMMNVVNRKPNGN